MMAEQCSTNDSCKDENIKFAFRLGLRCEFNDWTGESGIEYRAASLSTGRLKKGCARSNHVNVAPQSTTWIYSHNSRESRNWS
jgi:hypothetical protein